MNNTLPTSTEIEDGTPAARVMVVSPETAERWLQRNTSNRGIRPRHVTALASDMTAGRWQITGEAIKFDTEGRLIDGQHRLAAIVQSGQTVTLLVVSGLLSTSQQVMDSGAKRTASDALKFGGHNNTGVLAAAVRLAIGHEEQAFAYPGANSPAVTHSQVTTFVDLNPDIRDALSDTQGWRIVGVSHPAATAAVFRLRRIDIDDARHFITSVMDSHTAGRGDPRAALIHRLQAAKTQREVFRPSAEMWCIFRAWNAWRDGAQLKLIKFNRSYSWVDPR